MANLTKNESGRAFGMIEFDLNKEISILLPMHIICILSDYPMIYVFFTNRKRETKTCCIKYMAGKLDPYYFYRASGGSIVNMNQIVSFEKMDYRTLKLILAKKKRFYIKGDYIPDFLEKAVLFPTILDLTKH